MLRTGAYIRKSAATLKKENRNTTGGGHNCGTDGLFSRKKEVNEGRELYFRG